MTEKEFHNSLEAALTQNMRAIVVDLAQVQTQKVNTTKHGRREKALAYLLEIITGDTAFFPTQDHAMILLFLVRESLAMTHSPEATVALKRTESRLSYRLDNPEKLYGYSTCTACGDLMQRGQSHECTNRSAAAKDRIMAQDDSVKLVT